LLQHWAFLFTCICKEWLQDVSLGFSFARFGNKKL
jgi:hypothetical protein